VPAFLRFLSSGQVSTGSSDYYRSGGVRLCNKLIYAALWLPPICWGRTIQVMRRALFCLVLFGTSLIGQSEKSPDLNKLRPILMALKSSSASRPSLTNQLVEAMIALANKDRQPARSTVVSFADEFTGMVFGKALTNNQLDGLAAAIGEVMTGSTTNFKSSGHFRDILTAVSVDSMKKQTVTRRFIAIGEEVRGPDDSPSALGK